MLHRVAGKRLGRTKNQRTSLFRNLANQLILHEKIVTTEAKAKAVRPIVEKLITRAKENTLHNRRLLLKKLVSENTVRKMLEVIGPKFKDRQGGYTKIVRLGNRVNDAAPLVALFFVEEVSSVVLPPEKKETKKKLKVVEDKVVEKTEKPKRVKKVKKVEDGKK
jgi:large subunit ribosomal protein L17